MMILHDGIKGGRDGVDDAAQLTMGKHLIVIIRRGGGDRATASPPDDALRLMIPHVATVEKVAIASEASFHSRRFPPHVSIETVAVVESVVAKMTMNRVQGRRERVGLQRTRS